MSRFWYIMAMHALLATFGPVALRAEVECITSNQVYRISGDKTTEFLYLGSNTAIRCERYKRGDGSQIVSYILAKARRTGLPIEAYSTGDEVSSELVWNLRSVGASQSEQVVYGWGTSPSSDVDEQQCFFAVSLRDDKLVSFRTEEILRQELKRRWKIEYRQLEPINLAFANWVKCAGKTDKSTSAPY